MNSMNARLILKTAAALFLLLSGTAATAADDSPAAQSSADAPVAESPALPRLLSSVEMVVPKHCFARIADLSNFILDGRYADVLIVHDDEEPQSKQVSMVFLFNRNGTATHTLLTVSPDAKCTASYEITQLWANDCNTVHQNIYSTYNNKVELTPGAHLFSSSPTLSVLMSPVDGDKCLTVQKELIY